MVDTEEKIYLFKVTLDAYPEKKEKDEVYREMALKNTTSLHEFAETILGSFGLYIRMRQFCFCTKIQDADGKFLEYTSMADIEPLSANWSYERSVKNSYIYEIFEPGKELNFIYDLEEDNLYSWEFLVNCCSTIEALVGETYPKVINVVGETPGLCSRSTNEDLDTTDTEEYDRTDADEYNTKDADEYV